MRHTPIILALAMATALSGCLDTPAERTLGGALTGAVVADATGGSKTRGALIGAVAGGVSCGIPGFEGCSNY